jgi:hypothetical protein
MMRTYGPECNFLFFSVDFIKESFMNKNTVISMVVFDSALGLSHDFLKRFYRQNSFIDGKIPHQKNIENITYMIAKHCASPNTGTSEEARHLRDKPWLSRDNLIHQDTVAGKNMLGATYRARRFIVPMPEMMTSGPEFAHNAEG